LGKKYKGLSARQHIALGRLMKVISLLVVKLSVFLSKHYPQNSPQIKKMHRLDDLVSGLKSDLENAAAKDGDYNEPNGPFESVDWPEDMNLLRLYYGNTEEEIQEEVKKIMGSLSKEIIFRNPKIPHNLC
jgi:hypothetical protein